MRALGVLTLAGACFATSAALADGLTTRIETRPFYGATVTLEEGVRVFRPLPRHERVIINPNGQTPLALSYNESREYSYNHSTINAPETIVPSYPFYGPHGNVLPRGDHGRGHHHFGRRR